MGFARDFMCSLAEITGGQAVALDSADKLADVIINGSAEEISLTLLSREVEAEVDRVRAAAPELFAAMDEEEGESMVQQQAWSNLKSRGVMSKQMRHDGGMVQKHASVWKGVTSLSAAKKELCEKEGASMDMPAPSLAMASGMKSSSRSFAKKKSVAKGFLGSMFGGSFGESSAKGGTRAMARAPMESMESVMEASMTADDDVFARGMPAMASMAMPMSAPVEAKSVKTNVLVEDEISYDQVKRIMARKSKK